jgi:hypothetical protein
MEPLKSAEPRGVLENMPVSPPRAEVWIQPTLDGDEHLAGAGAETPDQPGEDAPLTSAQRELAGQQALGLTPDTVAEEIPEQVQRILDNVRQAQETIDHHRGTPEYAEHDDSEFLGLAWGDLDRRERDAILQPPKPDIAPASELARQTKERQAVHSGPEHG